MTDQDYADAMTLLEHWRDDNIEVATHNQFVDRLVREQRFLTVIKIAIQHMTQDEWELIGGLIRKFKDSLPKQ